jgi:6-pyruvoyl-tetrahydropterin synthase
MNIITSPQQQMLELFGTLHVNKKRQFIRNYDKKILLDDKNSADLERETMISTSIRKT